MLNSLSALVFSSANTQLIVVALLAIVPAICTSLATAYLGSKLFEYSSRQPEMFEKFSNIFYITLGVIDAVPIITVALSFIILFLNPTKVDTSKFQDNPGQIQEIKLPKR